MASPSEPWARVLLLFSVSPSQKPPDPRTAFPERGSLRTQEPRAGRERSLGSPCSRSGPSRLAQGSLEEGLPRGSCADADVESLQRLGSRLRGFARSRCPVLINQHFLEPWSPGHGDHAQPRARAPERQQHLGQNIPPLCVPALAGPHSGRLALAAPRTGQETHVF